MSERVQSRQHGGSTDSTEAQPLTKPQRRALAREAKAKAAATKKRRDALIGALAGLAAIAVIIGVFVFINNRSDKVESKPAAACGGAAFPKLPEGADPALCNKPAASAGTDELTKLTVTPLIEGKGPATQAGQTITVNYVGVSYKTGTEFDASWKRSQAFPFKVGAGDVIPGWDQGLVGVKVGSRVQLDIPSKLAYGDDPSSGRPTGPLRFIVDVLDAK